MRRARRRESNCFGGSRGSDSTKRVLQPPVSAPEGSQAIGDVGEIGVDLGDHAEEPAGLDDVAGPVVQVADDIPLPQMVLSDLLRYAAPRSISFSAPLRSPRSANAPAATIRPSAIKAGAGDP